MPPHFVQGTGIGTGSAAVATVPHVEQSQLRLRMRSSGRTISSGGPRRSITSRSVFMAQDVVETSGRRHQPSRFPDAAKRGTMAVMSWHHVPNMAGREARAGARRAGRFGEASAPADEVAQTG